MAYENVLDIYSREEFRSWLEHNYDTAKECYVCAKRGKLTDNNILWYLDAVEEAY